MTRLRLLDRIERAEAAAAPTSGNHGWRRFAVQGFTDHDDEAALVAFLRRSGHAIDDGENILVFNIVAPGEVLPRADMTEAVLGGLQRR